MQQIYEKTFRFHSKNFSSQSGIPIKNHPYLNKSKINLTFVNKETIQETKP